MKKYSGTIDVVVRDGSHSWSTRGNETPLRTIHFTAISAVNEDEAKEKAQNMTKYAHCSVWDHTIYEEDEDLEELVTC